VAAIAQSETLYVGDWVVNPSLDTIARAGETLKLEPRTMRLLLCLADSPDTVISVDRLLNDVWAGVVVGPASVYQAVSQLRKLLGDLDPDPTYIATVPRKGYRLIAPVRRLSSPSPPPEPSQDLKSPATESAAVPSVPDRRGAKWVTLAVVLLAGVALFGFWREKHARSNPEPASIVVLPFIDLTTEKSGQAFCDGLTEELSNWLSQIPSLRVVARTSAFAYRGPGEDVRKIGAALNTNHILEGSMRRSGDHMRITVQLIDARNGYHLWSAEYDKVLDDTITIQDDISRSVAQYLEIRLTPDTDERFAARRTANSRAYQLYLSARFYQRQRTRESNAHAIELYNQVIAADPKFALAYVGLSYSLLNQQGLDGRSIEDVARDVEPLVATALALNPQLPDVYTVRAALRSDQDRIAAARDDLRLAIARNPNDSVAMAEMGRLSMREGKPLDALASFNRAIVLDPLDFRLQTQLCMAFEDLARFDEAEAACKRAYELEPGNAEVVDGLATLAAARGDIGEALKWNAKSIKLAPDEFDFYWTRAELYLTLGLTERAEASLEQGHTAAGEEELANVVLGRVIFMQGGVDELRHYLEKMQLDHSSHAAVLLESAYLRLLVGDSQAVKTLIKRAIAAPDRVPFVDTPWAARVGESTQLSLATAELATGDRVAAIQHLTMLHTMLDHMIDSGVERAQTYALRAKTLALLGHSDEAMQDLFKASRLGWRESWWAQNEPYLASLSNRSDFQALMNRLNQANHEVAKKFALDDAATF
jgi:TolB-like protein/DNA-binding winged helix-turn-helix (wHTH) protein/Flp pilus assembly protein TadD